MMPSCLRRMLPILLAVAVASCSTGGVNSGRATPNPALAACDPQSTPIASNLVNTAHIGATSELYPANCQYFCAAVPAGATNVTFGISRLSEDLDLFVGIDTLSSVQGLSIQPGAGTYVWKSNHPGSASESITLINPRAALYYIEVCSYDNRASDYRIQVTIPQISLPDTAE